MRVRIGAARAEMVAEDEEAKLVRGDVRVRADREEGRKPEAGVVARQRRVVHDVHAEAVAPRVAEAGRREVRGHDRLARHEAAAVVVLGPHEKRGEKQHCLPRCKIRARRRTRARVYRPQRHATVAGAASVLHSGSAWVV